MIAPSTAISFVDGLASLVGVAGPRGAASRAAAAETQRAPASPDTVEISPQARLGYERMVQSQQIVAAASCDSCSGPGSTIDVRA